MPDLGRQIDRFLDELKRNNVSEHTLRAYNSVLRQFLANFSRPGQQTPALSEFEKYGTFADGSRRSTVRSSLPFRFAASWPGCVPCSRFWYAKVLAPVNLPPHVHYVSVPHNCAGKTLTTEQASALIDGVGKVERAWLRPRVRVDRGPDWVYDPLVVD